MAAGRRRTPKRQAVTRTKPRLPLEADEYSAWLVCFRGVLSGAIAAQRRLPSPAMMARWAATMADAAYAEASTRRRPVKRVKSPHLPTH
jgi:hypothetical protein